MPEDRRLCFKCQEVFSIEEYWKHIKQSGGITHIDAGGKYECPAFTQNMYRSNGNMICGFSKEVSALELVEHIDTSKAKGRICDKYAPTKECECGLKIYTLNEWHFCEETYKKCKYCHLYVQKKTNAYCEVKGNHYEKHLEWCIGNKLTKLESQVQELSEKLAKFEKLEQMLEKS